MGEKPDLSKTDWTRLDGAFRRASPRIKTILPVPVRTRQGETCAARRDAT